MSFNIHNVQGDVWSKGFPKSNETYYFFTIAEGKEKSFSKCLKKLATKMGDRSLISTLAMAQTDQGRKADARDAGTLAPLSNALIAFTMKGLDAVGIPTG